MNTTITKYRKKPVVIEAWQWNGLAIGEQIEDVAKFLEEWGCPCSLEEYMYETDTGMIHYPNYELFILTLEGIMHAPRGNYVIRGIEGEFYSCDPQIFEKTYEVVGE